MYTRYRVNIVYNDVLSCLHLRHRDVNGVYIITTIPVSERNRAHNNVVSGIMYYYTCLCRLYRRHRNS